MARKNGTKFIFARLENEAIAKIISLKGVHMKILLGCKVWQKLMKCWFGNLTAATCNF